MRLSWSVSQLVNRLALRTPGLTLLDSTLQGPVTAMRLNAVAGVVVSTDDRGMVEYWRCEDDFGFPADKVKFTLKSETDL